VRFGVVKSTLAAGGRAGEEHNTKCFGRKLVMK
jgi:hypothetical protein